MPEIGAKEYPDLEDPATKSSYSIILTDGASVEPRGETPDSNLLF